MILVFLWLCLVIYRFIHIAANGIIPFFFMAEVYCYVSVQFSSVQSLSHVWLFATPWIAACQASLSITISQSSLKLTSIESVMPSSHLILCRPLLHLPAIPPSIRVFFNEPIYIYLYHSFFIHSSVDEHSGCFHVLAIVNSAAMNIGCMYLLELEFSPEVCPEVIFGIIW